MDILYFTLEDENFNYGRLYRVQKSSILRLKCSSNLINKQIRVFSNLVPCDDKSIFDRETFFEYKWSSDNDDFDKYVELKCAQPGSYQVYFTINKLKQEENSFKYASGGLDILVLPEISFSNGKIVDVNALQVQTVLTKLLGTVDEWESRLKVTIKSGYNAIHFTPIEELSFESNSSYSIRDHLKLNKDSSKQGKFTLNDVDKLVEKLYKDYNCFCISDLVYNHMSNDSPFLKKCPQSAYNLVNSPFLIPAFLLDRLLYYFTIDIESGKYEHRGLKAKSLAYGNLNDIRSILIDELIPNLKLYEFYCLDLSKIREKLSEFIGGQNGHDKESYTNNYLSDLWSSLTIIQDPKFARLDSTIDFSLAKRIAHIDMNLNQDEYSSLSPNDRLNHILDKLIGHLSAKNNEKQEFINTCVQHAVDNVIANVKYHFFASDGPKFARICRKTPIVYLYFTFPFDDTSVLNEEKLISNSDYAKYAMAHNGWVMNHDPLKNFASADSLVYLKRELIAWGDSVKLRYGNSREDSPELWDYMSEYTRRIASSFHGVRLDNCHNTPLHVAQYMLDVARKIRPNLFVIAELFTNNEQTDNLFISKLGITLLIREALNAWNTHEFGRLLHRFGGDPVGSFFPQLSRPLKQSISPALFFDVTHDNRSLINSHSVFNTLPISALLLMCNCGYGSTRGYDELVPDEIDVVHEKRLYADWTDNEAKVTHNDIHVNNNSGIIKAKSLLNNLHYDLNEKGFREIYVDQLTEDIIAVTRHNPETFKSVVLLARTAYSYPSIGSYSNSFNQFKIPLKFGEVLFEAKLIENQKSHPYQKHHTRINGLQNYDLKIQKNLSSTNFKNSFFVRSIDMSENDTLIHFKEFPPGSIVAFYLTVSDDLLKSSLKLRKNIADLCSPNSSIDQIIEKLSFDELNILLYRCSDEEINENIFSSVYNVPNYGPLLFCGLQGFVNVLQKTRLNNDLGHPFYQNLREGDWMMDYIVRRLQANSNEIDSRQTLFKFSIWLSEQFDLVKRLPRSIIPSYFDIILISVYKKVIDYCVRLMKLPQSSFIEFLGLAGIQLTGISKTAKLPNTLVDGSINNHELLSIAAGLPHFSHGIMRNWGRDTFISLKGLLLLTNRYKDAKYLILTFASTLRHGLIPNLLGEGIISRYNARDAVWWWLKAIKDYCEIVPNGHQILFERVYRLYPTDDSPYPQDDIRKCPIQSLSEIIQEALTVHVNGLKFVERNAGPQIDEHMREEGFHNEIGVDLNTGFVFGGNRYNCGTWMDKMGSSHKAGNYGLPASPRDGSPVELVGISRSILEWLIKASESNNYPHKGIKLSKGEFLNWKDWAAKIDANFEKYFWIDEQSTETKLINQRNIYKDSVNSSLEWTDYQLRPNFLVALSEAPQMISPERARKALAQVKSTLLNDPNSLGIKTLDPSDWNYCGTYDNANATDNPKVAYGFNYHQGPEWLWPMGYYLRAVLKYAQDGDKKEAIDNVKGFLGKYYEHIEKTDWKSLPELTNANGETCIFSCPSQSWSIACIMEVCFELNKF